MPQPLELKSRRLSAEGLTGWEGKPYFAHPDLIAAANAALTLEMPLLLTGEAGCGKTDFAFAAASGLAGDDRHGPATGTPLQCYVRSDSRARDLLYHYDALRRFGDAHFGGEEGSSRAGEPRNYLHLEDLGKALVFPYLRVVLIDEVDKAPRDLPNDLLRELDQGSFEIREIPVGTAEPPREVEVGKPETYRHTMARPEGAPKPLMILTSNVERQLPNPFLRRCIFFHITFPGTDSLRKILASHLAELGEGPGELFLDRAVEVFEVLRAVPSLAKKPATSELICWAKALDALYHAEGVLSRLELFTRKQVGSGSSMNLPWKRLPALGCLIKLREDLHRLGAVGA